ncbi:hypothetical protein Cde04nite_36180 [Cellulomonas denverensis]|nr:hypothetical protein Cde04nite_36180 [Cellulomonas denverensis]
MKAKPSPARRSSAGGGPPIAAAAVSISPPRVSCQAVDASTGVPADHRLPSSAPTEDDTSAASAASTPTGSIAPPVPPSTTTSAAAPTAPPVTARTVGRSLFSGQASRISTSGLRAITEDAMLLGNNCAEA